MKNFNNYIFNKLNEADDDNILTSTENTIVFKNNTDEDDIEEWLSDNIKNIKLDKNKQLIYISPEYRKVKQISSENKNIDIKKIFNNVNNKSKDSLKHYSKEKIKELGKTLAYRTTLVGINSTDKSINAIVRDIFEEDSDDFLNKIQNLEDILSFSAATETLNILKNKKENVDSLIQELNDSDKSKNEKALKTIKEKYNRTYTTKYEQYKLAFDEGMKEQQQEMTKPDYEWKDPATGLPPKGIRQNAYKMLGKGIAKIADIGKSLESKIPAQHNLENDMARLFCMSIKLLAGGVHVLGKLGGLFGKGGKSTIKKLKDRHQKSQDVNKKIDNFNTEYKKYKKQVKTKTESLTFMGKIINEKVDQEQAQKDIIFKFNDLMYTVILPYISVRFGIITNSFENKDDLFLYKQTEDGWVSNNTQSGKMTIIDDNRQLLLNIYKNITTKLKEPLEEFKNEKINKIINGVPSDLTYNDTNAKQFKEWIDNIELTDDIGQDQINGLNNILKIYNEAVILTTTTLTAKNNYGNLLKYFQNTIKILEQSGYEPVLNGVKIKFKEDKTFNIPGLIYLKNKETEEPPQNIQQDANTTGKMIAALSDKIKDPNFMELISKTEEQIKKNEDEILDWMTKNPDKEKVYDEVQNKIGVEINKQIIPRMWMNNYILRMKDTNEAWYYKRMLNLLNEAEENHETNNDEGQTEKPQVNIEDLSKKALALLDDYLEKLYKAGSAEEFKQIYAEWIKNINSTIEEIKKAQNEEVNKQLETYKDKDPLEKAAAVAKAVEALSNNKEEPKEDKSGNNAETKESNETK